MALAVPIPFPGDVAGEYPIWLIRMITERRGDIGVERCAKIRGGGPQKRIAGSPAVVGGGRAHDRAIIQAHRLTLRAQDFSRENMARDAPAVAAHDVFGKTGQLGDPVEKWVAGGWLRRETGKADQIIG